MREEQNPPDDPKPESMSSELVDHVAESGSERGLVVTSGRSAPSGDTTASTDDDVDDLAVDEAIVRAPRKHRLTDKQAIGVIAGYFAARSIINRAGFGFALAGSPVWARPLARNVLTVMVLAGAAARHSPATLVATGCASVAISMLGAMVLYWAGWRFGEELAERGARERTSWSAIWNPKRVARAHRWLDRWGVFAVFGSRVFAPLVAPVALISGSSRMQLRKYVPAQLAGSAVWAGVVLYAGREAGGRIPWMDTLNATLSRWGPRIAIASIVLLVLAVGLNRAQPKDAASKGDASAREAD